MLKRYLRTRPAAFFGVNLSGPEFPTSNSRYGRVTEIDARYLRSVGCRLVRLPIAAEKLFPTLSSATADATEMALLKADIDVLAKYGISTIVDLHNFGRWATNYSSDGYPGQSGDILGGANYTSAVFVAQWETISTALKGRKGLAGYGLMNEPHGMTGKNLLTGPNALGYAGQTGNDWFAINGAVVTPNIGPAKNVYWQDDAFGISWGTGFGGVLQSRTLTAVQHTFSADAWSESGTVDWRFDVAGSGVGNKQANTTKTAFSATFTPSAATQNCGIVLLSAPGSGGNLRMSSVQLEIGSSATSYQSSPWQPIAQAAITAIGAIDAVTPIYVCGYEFGNASRWLMLNAQIKFTTVGNPIIYEAHQYADNSGVYSSSYDSAGYSAATLSGQLAEYLAWGGTTPGKFLGEIGVPVDNDPRYRTMLDNGLHAAYLAKVRGCQWFYGVKGTQDTGRLNIAPRGNSGVLPPIAQRLFQRAA